MLLGRYVIEMSLTNEGSEITSHPPNTHAWTCTYLLSYILGVNELQV